MRAKSILRAKEGTNRGILLKNEDKHSHFEGISRRGQGELPPLDAPCSFQMTVDFRLTSDFKYFNTFQLSLNLSSP